MVKLSKKIVWLCATAAVLSIMPYSLAISIKDGLGLATEQAQARVGRPLTPGSVAGVARRTTRRTVARHSYHGHHHCVLVNGVRVCR